MRDEFISRAGKIVDALLESSPETAMWAGDHRFDDRLPDYSPSATTARAAMLREASHALAEIDPDELPADDAVDLETIQNEVASRLFTLTETRDHEWNPLRHNPAELISPLVRRQTGPAADRLTALRARLAAVPDALATARDVLSGVPKLYARTGAAQFRGAAELIRYEVPGLLAQVPGLTADVEPVIAPAARACAEFADWLDARPDGPDPRLGRRRWEAKLWHTLDTPLSASELLSSAWSRLDRITGELDELAARLSGADPSTQNTIDVLARLSADRPDNTTILARATEAVADTTRFVTEHDLVTMVDDPLEVIEMPPWGRGVAAAYCDPPGSLETAAVPTYYAISPTPSDWDSAQVDSFFAEYNDHMLRDLTVHEAIPGHYLQLAHSRRHRGSTPVRALAASGTFIEGWAVYAEELMADNGYGGLEVRTQQLKMQLRMIINAIIDQSVHCADMSREDAMALMTGRGHQSEREAAAKWDRALLSSTQLSTYFVGYCEVARIAADRPDGTPLRAWHDAMLAHGNPAPRHLRTLLGLD